MQADSFFRDGGTPRSDPFVLARNVCNDDDKYTEPTCDRVVIQGFRRVTGGRCRKERRIIHNGSPVPTRGPVVSDDSHHHHHPTYLPLRRDFLPRRGGSKVQPETPSVNVIQKKKTDRSKRGY